MAFQCGDVALVGRPVAKRCLLMPAESGGLAESAAEPKAALLPAARRPDV